MAELFKNKDVKLTLIWVSLGLGKFANTVLDLILTHRATIVNCTHGKERKGLILVK